jgi:WbqC-like protein family
MNVVVSQSMLFPWVGMLEQIRLADVYVFYDDVQFSKGSFSNRVQVKLNNGTKWMTIPLRGAHLGQSIEETEFAPIESWRDRHVSLLSKSFETATFSADAIELARQVYQGVYKGVGALSRTSLMALVDYFGLRDNREFVDVRDLNVGGSGSARVLNIVKKLGGTRYITGHGASKYLEHQEFERADISVEYIDYQLRSYPQQHGPFTPFVSGLDLVANCGRNGSKYICSTTRSWRQFLDGSN